MPLCLGLPARPIAKGRLVRGPGGDSLIKVGTDVRARALGILGVSFCPILHYLQGSQFVFIKAFLGGPLPDYFYTSVGVPPLKLQTSFAKFYWS